MASARTRDALSSLSADDSNGVPEAANPRMELTEDERNLAINLREAMKEVPELDTVTDFMCAQLALICNDDTDGAIERALHLQHFRQEYAILDTPEHGRKCFRAYLTLFPRFHLSFTRYDDSYVMVFDNTEFNGSLVKTEEHVRTWLGGSYYTCNCFCPDFESIRNGAMIVLECQGYAWKKSFDLKDIKRLWVELASVYPMTFNKMKYFNPTSAMNIVVSMLRPFLPAHLRSRLEFVQLEQRLDTLYLQPTVQEANQRLLGRIEETLRMRYQNEQSFRL